MMPIVNIVLAADSEKELKKKIKNYKKRYHPAGYNTTVEGESYKMGDRFHVKISRWSSCD